jgi:type I restriction-modification system DNA methylase subunit
MSEELRQKGYLDKKGSLHGDKCGEFESFNIGATTLQQLQQAGVVPKKGYGAKKTAKPDALVIDRRGKHPAVKLVVENKDVGELDTSAKRQTIFKKTAETYCATLDCPIAAISDGQSFHWLTVDTSTCEWHEIVREDGYPLDTPVNLATSDGRELVAKTLKRISEELKPGEHVLQAIEAANPTTLAEQTWQTIWLASGENPESCLASFVEILLFKFLSDLGLLTKTRSGVRVDFDSVIALKEGEILRYYFDFVRPEVKRLFPPGSDGTSVINGIVLNPQNVDHGKLFAQILKKFELFGTLKRIDPEFKSRIFERFLKKTISQKNWGQFFTPRNVVKAMVAMSGVEFLPPGAVLADPACGVGGFILEPLLNKRPHDLRSADRPSLQYRAWDRDSKTIILAKANMLIHLSETLERDPVSAPKWLSPAMNEVFNSTGSSIIGSLSLKPSETFDLVMTNPPYVVTGTSTQRAVISGDAGLSTYFQLPGSGVENLFVQLIMNGLKPGARGLVIVPDGLLLRHTEESLKRSLLKRFILEGIISLPKNTFYSTPKKTYILIFRKKIYPDDRQTTPVFTYLVGAVGESLDAKRFVIPENDLPKASELFRMYQGAPSSFAVPAGEKRVKVWPVSKFQPEEHWLVDRWWPEAERIELGDVEATESISPEDLGDRLKSLADSLAELSALVLRDRSETETVNSKTVCLGDAKLFSMSIGKRVLKKDLHGKPRGPVPLYSANVTVPFGFIAASNLESFEYPSILWGIDGDFELAVKEAGVEFEITDHCGRLEILDSLLDPQYCRAALALARAHGFDRTLRPSLQRIRKLCFEVPVTSKGDFDLEAQKIFASRYTTVTEALADAAKLFQPLLNLQPDVLMPRR